ncbi:MAG: serine acetyltransferase [Pseudomonadota bacterium]
MSIGSEAYREAADRLRLPEVADRGALNQNPEKIGFWALVAEDFRAHGRNPFEQGFWTVFVHRFGNWRMGKPKIIRAPSTVLYWVMFKLVEWFCGMSVWYPVRLGRRVRFWHHSGIVISARFLGDDVQVRQGVTMGVARTDRLGELPIMEDGVDIGAGAVIVGPILVGKGARIAANALVFHDVPPGALAIGNPAQIRPPKEPNAL